MRFRLISSCALIFFALSNAALSGEWHIGESLKCENCHLPHASEQGQPLPGGPFSVLLLKSTINELCLSCHDGTDPMAPDVLEPVQMYQGTPSNESAAGHLILPGIENVNGHTIGLATATPLQDAAEVVDLSCASCHAVHGNGNYRNLLGDPAMSGDSISVVDGLDIFTEFSPDKPPTVAGSVTAYNRDNVGYRRNYSGWCSSCHDQLAVNSTTSSPAHFNAHPSDLAIDDYVGNYHTDPLHWVSGDGEGFITDGGGATGIMRVPYQVPLSTDYSSARQVSTSNEVFCGSCHKAHGGLNAHGLLWSYKEGGDTFIAGCQQCHNK